MHLLIGELTELANAKWEKVTKCSSDTALRDIKNLLQCGVLKQENAGGKSTSYAIDAEAYRQVQM